MLARMVFLWQYSTGVRGAEIRKMEQASGSAKTVDVSIARNVTPKTDIAQNAMGM